MDYCNDENAYDFKDPKKGQVMERYKLFQKKFELFWTSQDRQE